MKRDQRRNKQGKYKQHKEKSLLFPVFWEVIFMKEQLFLRQPLRSGIFFTGGMQLSEIKRKENNSKTCFRKHNKLWFFHFSNGLLFFSLLWIYFICSYDVLVLAYNEDLNHSCSYILHMGSRH